MATTSALGIVYRNFTKALGPLVGGRVTPYRQAADNTELPFIEVWQERGGMKQEAHGTRDYEVVMGVLATAGSKSESLELQELISRALHDGAPGEAAYVQNGPFAPLAGDVYYVQTITEAGLLGRLHIHRGRRAA